MKKEVKIGLFVIIAFVLLAYFVIKTKSCIEVFSKGKQYPLTAHFASIAGMYPSAPVKLAGVDIGIVEKIILDGRTAMVKMMIDNSITLTDDARAIISTIGFVGEKYVEIVYKDEFRTKHPQAIARGGEIKTIEPFSLDEIKTKFDNIYERTLTITDSVAAIVSDQNSQDAIRKIFTNLRSVTDTLREMSAGDGSINRAFSAIDRLSGKLDETAQGIRSLTKKLDDSLFGENQGMVNDLRLTTAKLQKIAEEIAAISQDLRQGKGTAGKLLTDESLYKKADESAATLRAILTDIENKKNALKKGQLGYGVEFDYFSKLGKTRTALNLSLVAPRTVIWGSASENPETGRARFTLVGGRRLGPVSLAAGLVESQLGANLRLNLFRDQLQLDVYASRFTRAASPLFKVRLIFSLSRNVSVLAGYYNWIDERQDQFLFGVGFGN